MRLDERLKKAKEASPPETLRKRVMDALETEPQKTPLTDSSRRPWMYGLAAAAALVIAVRLGVAPLPERGAAPMVLPTTLAAVTLPVAQDDDLNEFLEGTLDALYGYDDESNGGGGDETGDIGAFINHEIETIFWMDEGAENV